MIETGLQIANAQQIVINHHFNGFCFTVPGRNYCDPPRKNPPDCTQLRLLPSLPKCPENCRSGADFDRNNCSDCLVFEIETCVKLYNINSMRYDLPFCYIEVSSGMAKCQESKDERDLLRVLVVRKGMPATTPPPPPPPPPTTTPTVPPPTGPAQRNDLWLIILIASATLLIVAILITIVCCMCRFGASQEGPTIVYSRSNSLLDMEPTVRSRSLAGASRSSPRARSSVRSRR